MAKRQTTRRAGMWLVNDGSFAHPVETRTWRCPCGHTFKTDSTTLAPEGCPECHGLDAAPMPARRAS